MKAISSPRPCSRVIAILKAAYRPHVKANYLASPPLVVAYALAGTVDTNLMTDPIGKDKDGKDVFLKDIWPSNAEVQAAMEASLKPEMYAKRYDNVAQANDEWNKIKTSTGQVYEWNEKSTYIQEPGFFVDMPAEPRRPE